MCKIYAYMRVSTSDKKAKQDYERQKYILENSRIEFDMVFEERVSGGVRGTCRDEFNKMLEQLNEKDIVCFTETSRFGRNYVDCFDMLDLITQKKGASVKFLSNGFELAGGSKMNPYQWLTVSQFFIQDEFLKRQIGFNTSNSLQGKKSQGMVLGRPKKQVDTDNVAKIIELYNRGYNNDEIIELVGVSHRVFYRIIKELKDQGRIIVKRRAD